MHDPELLHGARQIAWTAAMYGNAAVRIASRARSLPRPRVDPRLIFIVGAPRSGTTFLAGALGSQPGLVDLGEVQPIKAAIPGLVGDAGAGRRLRRILDRVRRFSLSAHLRGVEQTPETAFVVSEVLAIYPDARAVHLVRDGRDVACSLLERGWLNVGRGGRDHVGGGLGAHARFWVEPGRETEFEQASDARRAAWAWRRYVSAARRASERTLELRYELLARDADAAATALAQHLDLDPVPLRATLSRAHARSVARWQRDLTSQQLADVEAEAGDLLRELGYDAADSA